jgi:SagB-type dehydrogenase family enzyme
MLFTGTYSLSQKKSEISMELKNFELIKLQKPDTIGGKSLMSAIKLRKTDRQFNSKNLSIRHLSNVLWVANGINRSNGKRTVPSAMALYPLKTYAVLSNGIYLYNTQKHQLEPIAKGDFRNLTGSQDFVKSAPLNLIFIADNSVYEAKKIPIEKRLYLAALDAGHCTQNVYLYCAAENMKCVVRAGANEKELLKVLGLNETHQFIVAQTLGY